MLFPYVQERAKVEYCGKKTSINTCIYVFVRLVAEERHK